MKTFRDKFTKALIILGGITIFAVLFYLDHVRFVW